MIATSRYHEIWYRVQMIFLKHCQIQNKTQHAHVKQGDEYVRPRDNFFSRIAPLNFIKMLRADETRCFRVRIAIQESSIILSPEWMCAKAINHLLTTRQKEQYLQCEFWLLLRTGQQHCSEVIKNEIHEVACA